MTRRLIIGLGNPGPRYDATRHNVGFMAVDRLADRHGLALTQEKFHGRYATGFVGDDSVVLLEPLTFMNRSGQSVQAARAFYGVDDSDVVVAHDDLDLDFGVSKIKIGGGHGGHNGLRDIFSKCGTRDFVRVRIGIGRPERGSVTDWVLSPYRPDELDTLDRQLDDVADALELILTSGAAAAQNEFNGRK